MQDENWPAMLAVWVLVMLAAGVGFAWGAPPANSTGEYSDWFRSLEQPGSGASCCSIADCRPVHHRVKDGHDEVKIDEEWVVVPPEKILPRRDNPTGEPIACYAPTRGIMCFIRGIET